MVGKFFGHNFNRIFLFALLCAFTITHALPLHANQVQLGFNDAAFIVRLEKLVNKLLKSKDKSIDKMIECLVEVKNEIDNSYNANININNLMDQLCSELKRNNCNVSQKQIDAIKKKINAQDRKCAAHLLYVANMMYMDSWATNDVDEQLIFNALSNLKKKDKNKQEEEVCLPALLVYGITVSLCGFFLMRLPIPACKDWGSKMVVAGVTACANSLCSENDKNKAKDKKH